MLKSIAEYSDSLASVAEKSVTRTVGRMREQTLPLIDKQTWDQIYYETCARIADATSEVGWNLANDVAAWAIKDD